MRKAAIVTTILLAIGCTCGLLWTYNSRVTNTLTTQSTSPNGACTLQLLDRKGFDRNFDVCLSRKGGTTIILFHSPDEGRPPGTERFIWSTDSRFAVLVGRHFFVESQFEASPGESIYLLLDIQNGVVIGCNASQASGPRFSLESLSRLTSWPADPALIPRATSLSSRPTP